MVRADFLLTICLATRESPTTGIFSFKIYTLTADNCNIYFLGQEFPSSGKKKSSRGMFMKKLIIFLTIVCFSLAAASPLLAAGRFYPYGEMKWQVEKAGKLSADVTVTENGLLYYPVGNKIACYNINTGSKLWERKMEVGGKITEPVLVEDYNLYVTGTEGVQQMKPNGSLTWIYRLYPKPKGNKSSAVIAPGPDNLIYVGVADGLYAVEPQKNFKWRYSDDKNVIQLLGDSEAIYLCTGDKDESYSLRALDRHGERIWHKGLGNLKDIRMSFGPDGHLYIVTNPAQLERNTSGEVRCLDKDTGRELWRFSVKSDDLSKLTFAQDTLYFSGQQKIFALNLNDGSLRWSLPLLNLSSGVAIDAGKQRLYAGSSDGRIFCVSLAGRLIWDKEIDKITNYTLHKDGGIMIDTGKDDKDSITRTPVVLQDGGILVFMSKGAIYKFVDVHKGS